MPNYPKIVAMLKKEFPNITSEEIDDMISKIPPNMPTVAIKGMIKMTKHLIDNPAKRKLLKTTPASSLIEDALASDEK